MGAVALPVRTTSGQQIAMAEGMQLQACPAAQIKNIHFIVCRILVRTCPILVENRRIVVGA